jgi:hypothetical protein
MRPFIALIVALAGTTQALRNLKLPPQAQIFSK